MVFAAIPAAEAASPAPPSTEPTTEVYLPPPEPPLSAEEQARLDNYRAAMNARTTVSLSMADPTELATTPGPDPTAELASLLVENSTAPAATPTPSGQATTDPNLRAHKDSFANDQVDSSYPYSPHTRLEPLTRHELKVGTVIPAILITAINSDLPGLIVVLVSRHVRDTRSGKRILIPAGSKLIGEYNSHVAFGQRRVLVVWRRVQFPDASTLDLPAAPGVDAVGQSGLQDKVDNHYWKTFGGATLLSIIGVGAQQSQPDDRDVTTRGLTTAEALSAELGRTWSTTSQEVIERNMDVQPTLAVRAGFRFSVLVNQDIILAPYAAYSGERDHRFWFKLITRTP